MTELQPKKPQTLPATDLRALRAQLQQMPAKRRVEALLARHDVLRVVRSMPVQDLYATVREIGLEDCLEILELASPRQVQAFLDLDGWRGDRLDSLSVTSWMRALFQASSDRAVTQLRGLDLEMLTLLFKLHARVYDLAAEEEPEADPGLHSITGDGRYLIAFGGADGEDDLLFVLKEFIDRLGSRDPLFVLRLCEAVRWELPSSLEEDALRWRNGRLADLGFVPFHDAVGIFAYIDPDAVLAAETVPWVRPVQPPAVDSEGEPVVDLSTSVLLPWDLLSDGKSALGSALGGLPDSLRARICHELMMVGNQVHSADGGDAGDPEAVRATMHRVVDTVGIALTYLAKGDGTKVTSPLARVPVAKLFQIGHSLGLRLSRELRTRISSKESGLSGNGLLRLDTPLRELAAGLLRRQPLFYAGLLDPDRVDYRPFSSLVEVALAAKALTEATFRAELLGPRGLGATDDLLEGQGVKDAAAQPSHGSILGAALLRVLLGEELAPGPIDASDLEEAHALFREPGTEDAIAKATRAFGEAARAFAPLPGAPTADAAAVRAQTYATQVLTAVRAELSSIVDERPDPRFVTTLWTRA